MSVESLSTSPPFRPGARPQRSPARNEKGDIVCTHDECKEDPPAFKRLCEFNKHMDKHERPYKCSNPACCKNPGFTYAGGLLRHQREVHSMHRTKDPFFCPHPSCNRSSGTGFSRRENLDEHLRRRHSGISMDEAIGSVASNESGPSRADFDAPQQHHRYHHRLEPMPANRKRRAGTDQRADDGERGLDAEFTALEEERLRTRIIALQQDNERIRAELYRRDQLLTDMSQENKRLRSMLSSTLPPLPPHTLYQSPSGG